MSSPLRASNEGLRRPRVARARELTGSSPLLAGFFSILLKVRLEARRGLVKYGCGGA